MTYHSKDFSDETEIESSLPTSKSTVKSSTRNKKTPWIVSVFVGLVIAYAFYKNSADTDAEPVPVAIQPTPVVNQSDYSANNKSAIRDTLAGADVVTDQWKRPTTENHTRSPTFNALQNAQHNSQNTHDRAHVGHVIITAPLPQDQGQQLYRHFWQQRQVAVRMIPVSDAARNTKKNKIVVVLGPVTTTEEAHTLSTSINTLVGETIATNIRPVIANSLLQPQDNE